MAQTAEPRGHSVQAAESEHVRVSEILISTPQPYDPEQVARAKQKATEIRESIRQHTDFADLAIKYSQGPSARVGGDIGYFDHGSLGQPIEDLIFQMKVGDVSVVGQFRFPHIERGLSGL
jgi:parvulin-like peptidyl-prolyl isomerase